MSAEKCNNEFHVTYTSGHRGREHYLAKNELRTRSWGLWSAKMRGPSCIQGWLEE